MNKVQVWISVHESIENLCDGLDDNTLYFPIGNTVDNRVMGRVMVDVNQITTVFADLQMRCVSPIIIGIQNMNGTDYDAVKYPKNITEFNTYMQPIDGIEPSQNTASGWKPFILT